MGLSSSKHNAAGPSSSSSGAAVRRGGSSGRRVLKSSCLGSHGSDNDEPQVSGCSNEENGKSVFNPSENNKSGSAACYRTDKAEENNDINDINSNIEWGESSFTNTTSREGNTSNDFSSRSLNPPNRFLSRFSFYPGNLSFRLTRGNSLSAASRSCPASSTGFMIPNQELEEEEEDCVSPCSSFGNRNESRRSHSRGCDFFPACFSRPSRTRDEHCASNSSPNNRVLNSGHDILRNVNNNPNLFSPTNPINAERRAAAREPVERNVRFSRTLSVGRLRDRVHRRTPPSDLDLCPITGRRGLDVETITADDNSLSQQVSSDNVGSSFGNPIYGGSQSNVYENPRARETRYRDLVEHRSNFLERRRRIRSQVRALQRMGSRFENLSGHERSCILSGQHRGGHCSCRNAAPDSNSNDDANARASISRIVMLAEALFEVLDEIHQQSVVLSSRPSVSSIGSVPAPNEVVDSLPLKIFSKLKRKQCDDAAQCYICLIEYEDGDSIRILPCHHEFHRVCVDKWLKEVHRVCPLCRRDICRPDSLTSGS